jgi:murein DD-endopeptidase MepM/ murein hydrolase activator NlpD
MPMKRCIAICAFAVLLAGGPAEAQFTYHGPGLLQPSKSGAGQKSRRIYAKNIRFPLALDKREDAYINSQVWGVGGMAGPRGLEYSRRNYRMPWSDNYCENRSWSMPLCPSGKGHQGVDIRGPKFAKNRWQIVAVESGRIEHVTDFSILILRGRSGTRYRYMHFNPKTLRVKRGQTVKQGQVLAMMSNILEYRPNTTVHLHFDVEQTLLFKNGARRVYVPPYSSLVVAYRKLKKLPPLDRKGRLALDKRREVH